MKSILPILLSGTIIFSTTVLVDSPVKTKREHSNAYTLLIPNPIKECKTLKEAEEIVGFKAAIPKKLPNGYTQKAIYTIDNSVIQIIYSNGENEIIFRQGKGKEDISGDYNKYNEEKTINLYGLDINIKGNDGKVNVATWVKGDYTFAISTNPQGEGIKECEIINMINSINAVA